MLRPQCSTRPDSVCCTVYSGSVPPSYYVCHRSALPRICFFGIVFMFAVHGDRASGAERSATAGAASERCAWPQFVSSWSCQFCPVHVALLKTLALLCLHLFGPDFGPCRHFGKEEKPRWHAHVLPRCFRAPGKLCCVTAPYTSEYIKLKLGCSKSSEIASPTSVGYVLCIWPTLLWPQLSWLAVVVKSTSTCTVLSQKIMYWDFPAAPFTLPPPCPSCCCSRRTHGLHLPNHRYDASLGQPLRGVPIRGGLVWHEKDGELGTASDPHM